MIRKNARESAIPSPFKTRLRMKHLELFRKVCEFQSLRKAAEASNMTQPAATKLVHELEDMFAMRLFNRDRRGMSPTQHGVIVQRHIDVLMADIVNMYTEVNMFASGGSGLIRLGILPSLSSALLSQSINELVAAHPRARFQLREATTDELLQELASNNLDMIFGRVLHARQASNLRVTKVYTESFEIVCSKQHSLARRRIVGWKELAQQQWILPATGPLREMAEDIFTVRGVLRPEITVASSSFHQMRYVIASGQLLGVLPRSIALRGRADGDLVILRAGQGAKFAPISLIARKEFEQPPLIEEFERIVLRVAGTLKLG